ncbi:MAG TPA: hypothetical protein PKW05_09610, partial [Anaerolineae bacterium]|nr:hypothetical protein [Anaerolineae bacterium]
MRRRLIQWMMAALVLGATLARTAAASSPGDWRCWGPGLPDPCRNGLYSITIDPSQGRIWAVGDRGTILHWDGYTWSKQANPAAANLRGVAAQGPQKAWAVGLEGTVLRYDSGTWTLSGPATSNWFRTVALVPGTSGHAWAACDKAGAGLWFYWNGSSWSNRYANRYQTFSGTVWAMEVLGAESGWAVGSVVGSVGGSVGQVGQLLRLGSDGWTRHATVAEELYGVALRTASDGWAVGKQGALYRWNGSDWTAVASPTKETLHAVHIVSAGDAWAVGDRGTILRWNGSTWTAVSCPVKHNLQAVALSGPNN